MPVDITSLLKEWGVTLGLLSVAATALLVLLILSLREFSLWFLRVGTIIRRQDEILGRLTEIEASLKAQGPKAQPLQMAKIEEALPAVPEAKPAPTFQLHN